MIASTRQKTETEKQSAKLTGSPMTDKVVNKLESNEEKSTCYYIRTNYEQKYHQNIPTVLKYLTSLFASKIIPSQLLTYKEDMDLVRAIEEQYPFRIHHTNFLFRASDHDFSAQAFHNVCDNPQLLHKLILIKSNYGNVFGACTLHSFHRSYGYFKGQTDDPKDNTFLFLNRSDNETIQRACPLIFKIKSTHKYFAVCCDAETGPAFGDGWDLHIDDKCNLKKKYKGIEKPLSVNCVKFSTFHNEEFPDVVLCGGNNKIYIQHLWWVCDDTGYVFDVEEYEVFELIH